MIRADTKPSYVIARLRILLREYLPVGLRQCKISSVTLTDLRVFTVCLPKLLVAPEPKSCLERHRQLFAHCLFDVLVDNFTRWFLGWLLGDDVEMMRKLRGCGRHFGISRRMRAELRKTSVGRLRHQVDIWNQDLRNTKHEYWIVDVLLSALHR